MLLRDLVSRFSFEIDKKDVANYDKTIASMSSKAVKLGLVFGGAFSIKSLLNLGKSARQVRENLKQVAGTKFDELENNLIKLRSRLDDVRPGLGEQLTNLEYNSTLTGYIQKIGKTKEALENFDKVAFSTFLRASAAGKNFQKEFSNSMSFINNGDTGLFDTFPGITSKKKSLLEYSLAARTPKNEPSGEVGRSIRLNELVKQSESVMAKMISNVRQLDASQFEITRSKRIGTETSDKANEEIDKLKAPIANAFNELIIKALNKETYFGDTDEKGNTEAGNSWRSLPNDLRKLFSNLAKESRDSHIERNSQKLNQTNDETKILQNEPISDLRKLFINLVDTSKNNHTERNLRRNNTVNNKNNITENNETNTNNNETQNNHKTVNINVNATYKVEGSDSRTIDKAVERGLNKAVNAASRQIERSEQ